MASDPHERSYDPGPPERVHPDDPIANGTRWRRERDSARATIDFILHAIEGERFKDEMGSTAEWYVGYALGTAGHAYHAASFVDLNDENERLRKALAELRAYAAAYSGLAMPLEGEETSFYAAEDRFAAAMDRAREALEAGER